MYKYEMDPTRTIGATEWTRDAGQTDGQTDGRTDRRMEWNQYTPQQLFTTLICIKLDMSTARRLLKSPQSLSGTSTHPTMVAHRSRSWSWMIDSHPFCSMSICPTIPQIRPFQFWPWNYKVKVMGVVSKGKTIQSAQYLNDFFFLLFHINQITIPEIQLFWNVTLKNQRSRSWVRSKVKVT